MPKQEDEQLKQEGEKPKEKSPEEVAAVATQKAKENEAVAALANAEQGGEGEAPVVESVEKNMEERAREIAQKYLETIPEEDRKLTDSKQVERVLWVLDQTMGSSHEKHLFSTRDKIGNAPPLVLDARYSDNPEGEAKAWREFSVDPVGNSKEMDKVRIIASSSLPESIRTAMLFIILKEGDYSAVSMAKEIVDGIDRDIVAEKYKSVEVVSADSLRQIAVRELLEGLYPDLVKSEKVSFLLEIKKMDTGSSRGEVMAMLEQYNQLVGEDAPFSKKFGDASNGAELLAKLKDGSIPDMGKNSRDASVRGVSSLLQKELEKVIAQKATSAEAK